MSAHKFPKAPPVKINLTKSNPPKKIIKPKITTICINTFFLEINLIDKYANIKIGRPNIDGIYDVKESLPLIRLIIIPQKNKNKP